jgi:hypothetical protein
VNIPNQTLPALLFSIKLMNGDIMLLTTFISVYLRQAKLYGNICSPVEGRLKTKPKHFLHIAVAIFLKKLELTVVFDQTIHWCL